MGMIYTTETTVRMGVEESRATITIVGTKDQVDAAHARILAALETLKAEQEAERQLQMIAGCRGCSE